MHARTIKAVMAVALFATGSVRAQVVLEGEKLETTVEGWVNVTGAACVSDADACVTRDGRVDAALRALVRSTRSTGPDIGARVVVESTPDGRFELAEASVLAFGDAGRVELGERPGLPDVLTGYAPNSFTYTSAEFGPASGASLDPAGGLPATFLPARQAAVVGELGVLGYAPALFDDRSMKALYVAPKFRGLLAGVSYAEDADDVRFRDLLQAGLVHETYFSQNVLRIGASWSHAEGVAPVSDLDSFSGGLTLIVDDALTLGLSGTSNGSTGLDQRGAHRSHAAGWVASANYNVGAWTFGGYLQQARAEGDSMRAGADRLEVLEVGVSWRASTRLRVYGAWFGARIDDEGRRLPDGNLWFLGIRMTL